MDRGFRSGITHLDTYSINARVFAAGQDRRACNLDYRFVYAATVVDGKQWIRQGLVAGETVVVQGQSRIAPGLKVTP